MPPGIFALVQASLNRYILHGPTSTLPDKIFISIHFIGAIKVNHQLTLSNVLFVPQFKVDLLYVSALTTLSQIKKPSFMIISFSFNHNIRRLS